MFDALGQHCAYCLRLFNQLGVGCLLVHQIGNVNWFAVFFHVTGFDACRNLRNKRIKRFDVTIYASALRFQPGNLNVNGFDTFTDGGSQQGFHNGNLFAPALGGFAPSGKLNGVKILITKDALKHGNVVGSHPRGCLLDGKSSTRVVLGKGQRNVEFFSIVPDNHFGESL